MEPATSPDRAAETSGPQLTVFNIQRMSTEDGPGLRTTVFVKGCSLECTWCHNPEGLSPNPQVVWHGPRCIHSRACDAVCPEDAIARSGDEIGIDRGRCTLCGDCVDRCPSGAIELWGVRWTLDDLVREVAKDRSYFETSGGGVTVSGGEPALRAAFLAPFLERCRASGLHTALDTCGMCSPSALHTLAGCADLVLFDLKEIDPERHTRFTGHRNDRILANLAAVGAQVRQDSLPAELWIRTPLIPGATLTEENIRGIGAFIARELGDAVTRWELCAFNNLAADKYHRLGLRWEFEGLELMTEADLRHFEEVGRGSGVDPEIVLATGRTRLERTGDAPAAGPSPVTERAG
ncbi:MAG: glycyl-radical enzyme activating protein [Planctomycetota bacterium]|jgi:pyruvate formate lyase activating enzyme